MPICRPSAARRRAVLAVALADVAGIAGLAAAQISPGIDDNPSAREKVERESEAAMDRLKGAVSRRKAQQQNGPSDLPKPSEVERRRSEEHTSELQSLMRISYAVFCLNKQKKNKSTVK